MELSRLINLSTLAAPDTPSKLSVQGHNGYMLGMNGTKIGVLKQTNQVRLSSHLESQRSMTLETQISLKPNKSQRTKLFTK